ncbi:MAG: DMT family transporter [Pseudomonadota bacterium]|nr:DMT family transporter [Pseudomonadota bacterium]
MDKQDEARGLAFGLLGVIIFALTLPMTRLAVGPAGEPQLPPLFVTGGRAAGAGLLSCAWLAAARAAPPARHLWSSVFVSALGTVVGFPLFLALALRRVDAMHAAVITGVLPLATAVAAAAWFRQRPSLGFWLCACLGTALVVAFAAWHSSGGLAVADVLLLVSVASAAVGYVAGARLSSEIAAESAICWVLVASLPLTIPATIATWPDRGASAAAWGGFGYVTVFSMWLGFFAWYRGLALGGTVRVSQVQVLQPFLAMLFAVPILGERLDVTLVVFAFAVVAVVLASRRMSVGTARLPGRPAAGEL